MILNLKDVRKTYEQGMEKINAVEGVNLTVQYGEFISIIGESGSGKTTLLNIIGGIDDQTSGEVLIENIELKNLNEEERTVFRRKNIGFIFQNYNLIPILNVRENIILPLNLDGREVDEVYLNEILELLDIKNKLYSFPNELSGGQQQRVAIARALISKPKIILADEPTGNLDHKNSEKIISLFSQMNKKFKQTIVMITHNLELTKYSNRVIKILDGKIIEERYNEN